MNWQIDNADPGLVGAMGILVIVMMIATAVVHIFFAIGVYHVSTNVFHAKRLWFAPPAVWTLATLIGGVFVAAIYWAIHHSTLAPEPSVPTLDRDTMAEDDPGAP